MIPQIVQQKCAISNQTYFLSFFVVHELKTESNLLATTQNTLEPLQQLAQAIQNTQQLHSNTLKTTQIPLSSIQVVSISYYTRKF